MSLRDGDQALMEPMMTEEKVEMFDLLAKLGFKGTEMGFPAASRIEYDFLRILMEREFVSDDVEVQVLAQCREYLIKRTSEALEGAKRAIIHIYSSASALQRDVMFRKDREDVKDIAIIGIKMVQWYMADCDTQIRLEYSPESFTGTELDFILDICTAVQEAWDTTKEKPIIINLPSTVETTTPNVCVDQIGWMNVHLKDRESIILSIYPHDDRGEGVTSTELVFPAGTNRVESILLGNGERTGNVDTLTVAYNMFSQDINPELNIKNIREVAKICERYAKMDTPSRHPHAGKLVFTAFSGSHRDVINKGTQALHEGNGQYQKVPYPPIDLGDIGREYEPIVRISSQSGKGGVAFVTGTFYGFRLPKDMYKEFADAIQKISGQRGGVTSEQIMGEFKKDYLGCREPMHSRKYRVIDTETGDDGFATLAKVTYSDHGIEKVFEGVGNGPIDTVQRGMEDALGIQIRVLDYSEHALASGSDAEAASYVRLVDRVTGRTTYGVGISSNITRASIRGVFSTVNRLFY